MTQNTSSAVMQQRGTSLAERDDFPTPCWATRALCEYVIGDDMSQQSVHEPACNRGFMTRALAEYFGTVYASDIADYCGNAVEDFLTSDGPGCDWVITNPPFKLAEQFIVKALTVASCGVAMLCRSSFAEGRGRYERLFKERPPTVVAQFVERVPMVKGRCDPKASTATSYAWFVWSSEVIKLPTLYRWIPPCRKRLERPGDYELPA